ncbi:MAG TPA: hypothetical protein VM487_09090 [Phycisphaerae bacterium]|nr:hypothetical protein [Phycisphaerae bacterium]
MYTPLLFWLMLLLPGYVIVRLVARDDLRSGLLGTIGLSYLGSFALLAPVSIAGYLLRLPLATLSGACVITSAAAAAYIIYRRWWGEIGRLVLAALSIELLIVGIDLLTGARMGSHLGGDAVIHVGRIRFLLDNGFSNCDPCYNFDVPFPFYHTNLLHAVLASCAQLTGSEAVTVWVVSLVWAKLVVAAGCYYVGWCVFGRIWPAWVVALLAIGQRAPVTFMLYPNTIAMYWLVAMMLGFAVQAGQARRGWPAALKLGAGSFVLGQIHGLYAIFAGLATAPALCLLLVLRLVRDRAQSLAVLACLAALWTGAPFVIASKVLTRTGVSQTPVADDDGPPALGLKAYHFRRLDDGSVVVKGRFTWQLWLALGATVVALATRRRKEVLIIASAMAVVLVVFHVPPICTAFVGALGQGWMLLRLGGVRWLAWAVLVLGTAAYIIELLFDRWQSRTTRHNPTARNEPIAGCAGNPPPR